MRTLVKLILGLGTVIGAFVLWLAHDELLMMSADARHGDAAVWVYTPHVAPGDVITLGVRVSAGEDIGIQEVVVRDGAREHRAHGDGADWGDTITTRGAPSDAADSLDVRVDVRSDARPGTTMRLVVHVSYVVANQWGASSFSNSSQSAEITVDVPVRTPGGATLHRALSALWGLGLLGALCAGLFFAMPRVDRWADRNQDVFGDGEMAGLFLLLVIVFNAMIIGRWVFALPLVAATGYTGTGFFVLCCAVWTIVPIVACVYGYKHGKNQAALGVIEVRAVEGRPVLDRGDPYRAERDAAAEALALSKRSAQTPATLAAVADALRAAGLAPAVKRKRLTLADGDGKPTMLLIARDPARVTVDTVVFRNRDMRAALDVLHATLPVLGPVEVRFPFGNFLVDQRSTRDQLRTEFDDRFKAWIEGIKRSLRPLDVTKLLVVLLAFTLAACGGPKAPHEDPEPEPVDAAAPPAGDIPAELITVVERALELVDALSAAAEGAAGDCVAMQTAMKAVADGPEGGAVHEVDRHPEWEKHADTIAERYGTRLEAAQTRLMQSISACAQDQASYDPIYAVLVQVGIGEE